MIPTMHFLWRPVNYSLAATINMGQKFGAPPSFCCGRSGVPI